ncbi:MAG: hypothetical protein F4X66_17720, partial [Chloroflexi bacterium]|nr:hypothetical protein [Chloroflexota bacterium]
GGGGRGPRPAPPPPPPHPPPPPPRSNAKGDETRHRAGNCLHFSIPALRRPGSEETARPVRPSRSIA